MGLGPQVEDGSVGMGGVGGCSGWHEVATNLSIGLATPHLGPLDRFDPLDEAIAALS